LTNKLESFGPIYVVNLEDRKDRKDFMLKQFKENGIKDFTFINAIDGNKQGLESDVIRMEELKLTKPEIGATISHLIAIKTWLETSDSEYAIIMEDDVSFETVRYWKFNWVNFLNNITNQYDMVQLCIIHNININTNLHLREANDWSAGVYLIKRAHAKKLIETHYVNDKFNLYLDRKSVADHLIYHGAKTYSAPLFVTNLKLDSSINQNHILQSHTRSYNQIIEFWKSMDSDIQEKTTSRGYISYYKNDLAFTKFLSINKIYEQDLIENYLSDIIKNASTILDIGAHCGSHTIVYKNINPDVKVHSFEPQKKLFELLTKNVEANKFSNVKLYNNAVANKPIKYSLGKSISDGASVDLPISYGKNTYSNLGGVKLGLGGESVECITIDSLNLDSCDYIKIDVEGAEHLVIEGAKETIKRFKPAIMFEHNSQRLSDETLKLFDAAEIPDIFKALEELGYTVTAIDSAGNFLAKM
jgi:FkbM family methyltransferase